MSTDDQLVEFIAPFPVQNCVQRLRNQNEPVNLLSFRWQTRIVVQVKPVDEFTYRYYVKRVEKSALVKWGGVGEAVGYLRAHSPRETLVICQPRIRWLYIALSCGAFLVAMLVIIFGYIADGRIPLASAPLWLGIGFLVCLAISGFVWLYARNHANEMANLVRRVLGDPTHY